MAGKSDSEIAKLIGSPASSVRNNIGNGYISPALSNFSCSRMFNIAAAAFISGKDTKPEDYFKVNLTTSTLCQMFGACAPKGKD